ncbi:SHOCT domain-containing protein [Aquipuribacter sp. SD81]|uniref:SHOCT domain-containing protein n=1 Tax=Aquipuribacter sp. SD81 TaxID=3127703 RepID=UPI00301B6343
MARTAVISGTATRVSSGVAHRQAQRFAAEQAAAQPPPAPAGYAPAYAPPPVPPPPAAAPASTEDRLQQLERLAALRSSGILTDQEFAAEKARILGS